MKIEQIERKSLKYTDFMDQINIFWDNVEEEGVDAKINSEQMKDREENFDNSNQI